MSGIYLHIPFCKQACTYCDFHFSTGMSGKTELIKAMVNEIRHRQDYLTDREVNSIYFGGGTPSLLNQIEIESLFEAISTFLNPIRSAEITLEANPDDITKSRLKEWKKMGVNRLSIGLQSFNNNELRWMNRAHTAEESSSSVKMAQDMGFDNISIDLIYGSKFQTIQSWEETLQQALVLNTQHISSYNLCIEHKTALGVNFKKGKEPAVNDDLSAQQFERMQKDLTHAGFIQYEISNFGKEGFFAQHNSNYWLQKQYLGIGPSAHSFDGTSRQWNVKNNMLYTKALNENNNFFEKEELSADNRYNEYVLTRLRTIWGCDMNEIEEQFGKTYKDHFCRIAAARTAQFERKENVFVLKDSARFLADGIAADLFMQT